MVEPPRLTVSREGCLDSRGTSSARRAASSVNELRIALSSVPEDDQQEEPTRGASSVHDERYTNPQAHTTVRRRKAIGTLTAEATERSIAEAKDAVELEAFRAALANTYPDDPRLGEMLALIEQRLPQVPALVIESVSGGRAWRVEWHDAYPISSLGSSRVGVAAWVLVMAPGPRLLTAPAWDRSPDRARWTAKLEPYVLAAIEAE